MNLAAAGIQLLSSMFWYSNKSVNCKWEDSKSKNNKQIYFTVPFPGKIFLFSSPVQRQKLILPKALLKVLTEEIIPQGLSLQLQLRANVTPHIKVLELHWAAAEWHLSVGRTGVSLRGFFSKSEPQVTHLDPSRDVSDLLSVSNASGPWSPAPRVPARTPRTLHFGKWKPFFHPPPVFPPESVLGSRLFQVL